MEIFFPLVLGIILGFIVQKGYFCCYDGLTSALMFKNYRTLRAIIWAILSATLGFYYLAYLGIITIVPQPFFWPGSIVGGILFGIGITLARGCMFGIFLRAGSGFLNYFIASLGIFFGLGLGGILVIFGPIEAIHQLGLLEPDAPAFLLPSMLPWDTRITVALFSLLLIWLLFRFTPLKSTGGFLTGFKAPTTGNGSKEKDSFWNKFLKKRWSASITGILIGLLIMLGFARWNFLALPTFFRNTSSFDSIFTKPSLFLWLIFFMFGIFLGIVAASIIAGEFRIRKTSFWEQKSFLIFLGGFLMGFGAVLANGCSIFLFFVFIPQLAFGGFLTISFVVGTVWLITRSSFKSLKI